MKLRLIGHDAVADSVPMDSVLYESYMQAAPDEETAFPDPFDATASSEEECIHLFGFNLNGVQ